MDRPNLIIFKFNTLYEILKEVDEYLNFEIIEATNEKILQELKISSKNFLILTSKNIQGVDKQLYFDNLPIKFFKLTEKESNIILFLYNSKNPVTINQLQSEVWGYNSKLDTHTVETHVYRLRKKLLKNFNDNSFIQSKKNGYQIK